MNCSYCQTQFDHSAHTPRLLIFCGHSLCEKCCQLLHTNCRIQCPECFSNTFIEEVNFLPKNLALLKVNNNSSLMSTHGNCLKHEKKFEAFCNKEKVLICVDCILHDSHRNHEMDSIKNAHAQEEQIFTQSLQSLEQCLTRNQAKYDENLASEKEFIDQYETACDQIQQYFEELHDIFQREKESQLAKVREHYDANIMKFQDKNTKFVNRVDQLIHGLEAMRNYSGTSDIEFLGSVSLRQEIISRVGIHVQEALKVTIPSISKNGIADCIIKGIDKNFKPAIVISTGNSNGSSVVTTSKAYQPNAKTKKNSSQFGQPIPQISKQYESLQPTNQNIKPMSKKNVRKDVSSTASPATVSMINSKLPTSPPLARACTNMEKDKEKKSPSIQRQKVSERERERFELPKNCDISIVEQKQSLFNSFFSNMTSFLTDVKQIYVIGGFDEDSSNVMKFNVSNFTWETVTSLKNPRSKFGCVLVDKSIYIMGGKKGKERVSDIEIFTNGVWKSGPSLRKKRSGFGIVSYQHFIYIIGGNDGENILSSTQILNTLTGEWSRAEPLNEPRDQLAACIGKDQRIYAIGGFGGKNNESLKSVEAFDMVSQKWIKVPSLNTQRRALAAGSLADGIYAIGGFDGQRHLDSVQKYEEGSSQWVQVASLRRGRCTHSAISIFDSQQIIIMGGFDEQALDSVQKYSLISNEWQEIAKMPCPRFMHSCVLMSQ